MVFLLPIISIMIGVGFDHALRVLSQRIRPQVAWPMVMLFLGWADCRSGSIASDLSELLYLAAGGLPGSVKLGLESNYWGDAVTSQFLDQCAKRFRPKSTSTCSRHFTQVMRFERLRSACCKRQQRVMPGHMFDPKRVAGSSCFVGKVTCMTHCPLRLPSVGNVEISVEREWFGWLACYGFPPASNRDGGAAPREICQNFGLLPRTGPSPLADCLRRINLKPSTSRLDWCGSRPTIAPSNCSLSAKGVRMSLRLKLFIMLFLEFFIWELASADLCYLPSLNFSATQQSLIINAFPAAAILAMFFSNQFADRNFAAEKFLAFSHLVSGLAIMGCAFSTTFWPFFVCMLVHCIFMCPPFRLRTRLHFPV